jgi:SAM-dependent methyltransferase
MKRVDRLLQQWRIAVAGRHIPAGSRVLDIGCFDGALFHRLGQQISTGVGIDPALSQPIDDDRFQFISGRFPGDLPETEPFDVATMLAVLEHFPAEDLGPLVLACADRIKPRGHLIITVPAPIVDPLLGCLQSLRVIDGMCVEEHRGFNPSTTPTLFGGKNFSLHRAKRFQLGLNHLFVFERTDDIRPAAAGTHRFTVEIPGATG